jgi:Bacterial membrane protein YfhO
MTLRRFTFDLLLTPIAAPRGEAGTMDSTSRRAVAIVMLLALALYILPILLGFGWTSLSGPSLQNIRVHQYRYPAHKITAEPWGAAVVVTPAESRLRQYILNGDLPLWNPYQGLGQPYAAQGEGSPYSPSAILRALAPPWAGNLITFAMFLLASLATLVVARLLGLSLGAQGFAASAMFLSTSLTFHISRYNIADQNAFIPVQLAAVLWAAKRQSRRAYALLALTTALTLIAGFVQTAIATVALSGVLGCILIVVTVETFQARLRAAALLIASTGVGAALVAPFLFPIAELATIGFHKNIISVVNYTPPIANLIAFNYPALLGEPLTNNSLIRVDWDNLFATSSITVFLLCLIGIAASKWNDSSQRTMFWAILIVALVLTLRFMNLPPLSWLAKLPGLGQMTTKHTQAITAFFLLLAAALALDQAQHWNRARVKLIVLGATLFAVVMVVAGAEISGWKRGLVRAIGVWGGYPAATLIALVFLAVWTWLARKAPAFGSQRFAAIVGIVATAELSVYIPLGEMFWGMAYLRLLVAAGIVAAGCFYVYGRNALAMGAATVAVCLYALLIVLPPEGLPSLQHTREVPAFARYVRQHAGHTYRSFGIFPDHSSEVPVQDLGVVGPLAPSGFAAFIHAIDPEGRLGYAASTVFVLAGWGNVSTEQYLRHRAIFDWLGVRFLVLEKSLLDNANRGMLNLAKERPSEFAVGFDDENTRVIESLHARPRFEFASPLASVRSQAAIVRQLQNDPASIESVARVEADGVDAQQVAALERPSSADTVRLVGESPGYLRLTASTTSSRLLVVKDSFFPGWRATVDGRETPLLRVNGMVQGVRVPAGGDHTIELTYLPASFTYGSIVAATALAAFLGLLVIASRDSRHSAALALALGLACVGVIAAMPYFFREREKSTGRLGTLVAACALDLRGVSVERHKTDSTNTSQPFLKATNRAYLPAVTLAGAHVVIGPGTLVYRKETGIAEVDAHGHFRPLTGDEGSTVKLGPTSACEGTGGPSGVFAGGRWKLTESRTPD